MPTFKEASAQFEELEASFEAIREARSCDDDCRIDAHLVHYMQDMARLTAAFIEVVAMNPPQTDDNEHRLGVFETIGRR